jgi:FKBP-type peptidyl-prolyl cis-trans isomerase
MKYYLALLTSFWVLSVALFAQNPPLNNSDSNKISLTTTADSAQYILGAYLGQYITANGMTITNSDLFIKGMNDVLSNSPLLVNAETIPVKMNDYLNRMNKERNQLLEKQLFDKIKSQPGVGMLPDGVCYSVSKPGKGKRPEQADSIQIHVKGYLPTGKVFEDTYTRNIPLKTTAGTLIPGLKEVLPIMYEGSVWRVFVPSALAYAEKGIQGIIPPYSAIVFDVELIKVY